MTHSAGLEARFVRLYFDRHIMARLAIDLRGRGFGGAATAAITQAALDDGAEGVVLFTDLDNPTSNTLYQRLGYRPISDRAVVLR